MECSGKDGEHQATKKARPCGTSREIAVVELVER